MLLISVGVAERVLIWLIKIFIVKPDVRTRSGVYKLSKIRLRKERGQYWCSDRVVDEWNKLIRYEVVANTLESFK